jgi:hypothetical protein
MFEPIIGLDPKGVRMLKKLLETTEESAHSKQRRVKT